MFGTVNQSVTFPVSNSVPFTEIMWTKNRDKVLEWEAGSSVRVFPPFVGRVHLDTTSGSLTIFNLTYSDEADYKLDSLSSGDILFTLKVIGEYSINLFHKLVCLTWQLSQLFFLIYFLFI